MIQTNWPTLLIALKLLLAVACGGAIGFERELSRKPAGLRTNVLVCVAAALFMIVSRHIGGGLPYTDPARLVAQVVTAIGFIGAGVILQARGSVTGLTTAATILMVAAVGITIGEGMFTVTLMTTALIIVVLVVLRKVERALIRGRRLFHYVVKTTDAPQSLSRLLDLLERECLRLDDFSVKDVDQGQHELRFALVTSLEENSRLIGLLREVGTEVQGSTAAGLD